MLNFDAIRKGINISPDISVIFWQIYIYITIPVKEKNLSIQSPRDPESGLGTIDQN